MCSFGTQFAEKRATASLKTLAGRLLKLTEFTVSCELRFLGTVNSLHVDPLFQNLLKIFYLNFDFRNLVPMTCDMSAAVRDGNLLQITSVWKMKINLSK
jgi:hypothetical protein